MRYLQSDHDLEGVVDSPLSTGKSTDHDDTKGEPSGEEAQNTNLFNRLRRFYNNIKSMNYPATKKEENSEDEVLGRTCLHLPL